MGGGGECRPGPEPKGRGGGGGALRTPKWLYGRMDFVRRRFCFRHMAGGELLFSLHVFLLKVLRISWRVQKWVNNTKKKYDPPTRPLGLWLMGA